ncbi:histidine phosphatase family protein [Mucilaginibacter sp. HMF5004]|uniref:SixA phosphatase family protein n=1 Tax=Mucilaginibacter rivuli TaxID=2857527 RepID=UPI001C5E67B8|nr:histidine phosphatase family protein [Mucilaginibacter rivuli]MBW4890730.1 histidine phosphatase family protein [Mucilaginibacter rivuli]
MKKLMLVRHAKSDWGDAFLDDFDRPLNNRGLQSAPEMASRLLKKHIIPQYSISSPALRAKTTANIFADKLGLAEPTYNRSIYEAKYADLLRLINELPDAYDFVALYGHNPGLSDLLYGLTGDMNDMPTCAVAIINFNLPEWKMISGDTGRVEYYDYPKSGD